MMRGFSLAVWAALSVLGCGGGDEAKGGSAGADGGADGPAASSPYTIEAFDAVRITSDSSAPNFQHATADIELRDAPFASVKLVVDLGTTCYPFDGWKDNPPPPGQDWPADCDAFDRNFELSLDDPEADGAAPGLELVRAITPFGGPEHLEVDVTDVANGSPGKHRLKVTIPTWADGAGKVSGSSGGWNVTARLEVTPGPAPRRVLAVTPLFYGDQSGPDANERSAKLVVPEGTRRARVEYRVTGHGGGTGAGCIGPAEEFCARVHTVFLDEQQIGLLDPWRTDCDALCTLAHQDNGGAGFDYCKENPCGAIESVRAPRANWCPGSMTPPFILEGGPMTEPGEHELRWRVSEIAEGGMWRVSATFFAFGD
ncbi:MAG: peptide-N-glycosidase F-related protein [Sorangiineae bacterium]|nr:peptide-N-glycosidase F-related protein [Polyangiaceae bacterium]MEB2322642.1 peptide-N-glycosidase F-related protein [Sorangiineae bacterium]